MPPQVQTGLLANKLGNRMTQAMGEHKGKSVQVGSARLPGGIEHGIAKLVLMQIAPMKTGKHVGEPCFSAQGVVVSPITHEGIKVAGARTSLRPIPLCDTPEATGEKAKRTFSDHWADFRNRLLIFGIDTDKMTGTPQQVEALILAALSDCVKRNVHFQFRTWKGGKMELNKLDNGKIAVVNQGKTLGVFQTQGAALKAYPFAGRDPMVNEDWLGVCDAPNLASHPETVTQDDTATQPSANGTPAAEPAEPFNEFEDQGGAAPDAAGGSDAEVDALAAKADGGDAAANAEISKWSRQYIDSGLVTEAEVNGAENWATCVSMIRERDAKGVDADEPVVEEEETVEEETVWEPVKNGKALVIKDKNGKELKNPQECTVTSIKDDGTVNVRRASDKQVISVTADRLGPPSE